MGGETVSDERYSRAPSVRISKASSAYTVQYWTFHFSLGGKSKGRMVRVQSVERNRPWVRVMEED